MLPFWLPVTGPFTAGIVGGNKADGVAAGIAAALVPAIATGIALFLSATLLTGFPLVGILTGAGAFALVANARGRCCGSDHRRRHRVGHADGRRSSPARA